MDFNSVLAFIILVLICSAYIWISPRMIRKF